jgi:hypothetical protein
MPKDGKKSDKRDKRDKQGKRRKNSQRATALAPVRILQRSPPAASAVAAGVLVAGIASLWRIRT